MSQQGVSIGRDISLVVILPDSTDLSLGDVIRVTRKQISSTEQLTLLTGETLPLRFFKGWQGTVEAYRTGSALDLYFAGLEADCFAGTSESPVSMLETMQEPDGSISQWLYSGVLLEFNDPGDADSDKPIKQTVNWYATRKIAQ